MKKCVVFVSAVVIIISACVQSSKWTKSEINRKLEEVFPTATAIEVMDSIEAKGSKTDTMDMPLPVYKALVTEKDYERYSFILYFYNTSLSDTSTWAKVFKAVMIHDIGAGFGTKKVEYVCSMPQFDKTGDKLMVYAPLLALPESYDVSGKEKAIRKVFDLQEIKFKGAKISDPKLEDKSLH